MDIAGGFNHSLARKADGSVVAWGDNTFEQRNVPGGGSVMAIAARPEQSGLPNYSFGRVPIWLPTQT